MFGLTPFILNEHEKVSSDSPRVIQGADVYNALCPVSSLTGKRENALSVLKKVFSDPQKSRYINAILQELPSVRCMQGTDADRIAVLASRLDVGLPAENDMLTKALESMTDVLFADTNKVEKTSNVIDFSGDDAGETSKE